MSRASAVQYPDGTVRVVVSNGGNTGFVNLERHEAYTLIQDLTKALAGGRWDQAEGGEGDNAE